MLPESDKGRDGAHRGEMEGQSQKDGCGTDNKPGAVRQERYEHHYGERVSKLTLQVEVGVLAPWGESRMVAEHCLWDTGATNVTMNKAFADRMGIVPLRPEDDELSPMMMVDANYVGTVMASLRIGDVLIPYDLIKVTDFDPTGRFANMGYEVPDLLIGMSVIGMGRFEVDSTGDETVVTFEMPT